MLESQAVASFIKAFALIFAIMDPFGSLPVFLVVTRNLNPVNRIKAANKALIVATAVVLIFLFMGTQILELFDISVSDFKIAGGALLLVLGAQLVFDFGKKETPSKDFNVAATIIGVPLITGPGVITSIIVLAADPNTGMWVTLAAALTSLFVNWLILSNATRLLKVLGQNMIDISSKILGLLLIAVAVSFIRSGLGF
jgi:multiple antibiotic resistance protein